MKKYKLSPWHDGSVKPVRKGVYQTEAVGDTEDYYQYWNGKFWCSSRSSPENAALFVDEIGYSDIYAWRGILK